MSGPKDNPADDDPHHECAAEIHRLEVALARETERADYAWKNTHEIDKVRVEQAKHLEEAQRLLQDWKELADDLLEDIELHGLHDHPEWNYRIQKAKFCELAPVEQAILAALDGPNDPEAPSDPKEFLAWLNEEAV